jgi:hypothetical protein
LVFHTEEKYLMLLRTGEKIRKILLLVKKKV